MNKKQLIAVGALLALTGCSLLIPQTRYITETFFPDFDVEIDTPAFQKNSGFTTHAELMSFLEKIVAENSSKVTMEVIGESQQGRSIPMVSFKHSNNPAVKVWLQGGLHGNEPASSEGLLWLIQQLVSDPAWAEVLEQAEIAIVPTVNVDGYEVQDRYADNGLDLNRDQTKLMVKESILLKRAFNKFSPDVAVDFHEYRPYRRDFVFFGENGITSSYDVMFLYSGNLNVPESIRQLTQDVFVEDAKKEMTRRGLTHRDYISTLKVMGDVQFNQGSTNARASATSFALANTVSSLIEVRGVGLGRESFKRRVMTTFWVAQSYLRTAVRESVRVRETIQASLRGSNRVAVTSVRLKEAATIEAIDLIQSKKTDLNVVIHDALRSQPVLTRLRPKAYLLLPDQMDLAQKLETLGLVVRKTKVTQSLKVESFLVTDARREPLRYEGVYRQKAQTKVIEKSIILPKGSFIVELNQRRANLAVEVLEPESSNGFVSFGVLEVESGQELPVYRYMNESDLK